MPKINEIAPDIYRVCTYVPEIDLQFSLFVIRDEEPLLFHTLTRAMFPSMREAVARLIDLNKLRWISFSHFEADESGALNEWLAVAPDALPVSSPLAAMVNINDFASRPARTLMGEETVDTGAHHFRFISTPHLPHGWDAGVLFEENTGTLLCSDLLHQSGDVEALTTSDVLGRVRETLTAYQQHPLLANYMPYSELTHTQLQRLAQLSPKILATMHGSVYEGNGNKVLLDLDNILREVLTQPSAKANCSAG
jgi:flavorubredoxin